MRSVSMILTLFVVLLMSILISPTGHAQLGPNESAPTVRKLLLDQRAIIQQVGMHNHEQAAMKLCELMQGYSKQISKLKRSNSQVEYRRVYEMLLYDCQMAISRMNNEQAVNTYIKVMKRLDVEAQLAVLLGLELSLGHEKTPDELMGYLAKLITRSRDIRLKVAAIDYLGRQREPALLDQMHEALLDKRVRFPVSMAVIRALPEINVPQKSVPVLIKYFEGQKNGRERFEVLAALRMMTGQQNYATPQAFAEWWKKNAESFKPIPISSMKSQFNWEVDLDTDDQDELRYYDIPVVSKRIVFIIDESGSMREPATLSSTQDVGPGKLPAQPTRLDVAKHTLKNLIAKLPDDYAFNIIYYSSDARVFDPRRMVKATKSNKAKAYRFVAGGTANGTTRTMLATERVLMDMALREDVGTIFILTDGLPEPMIEPVNMVATAQNNQQNLNFEKVWSAHASEQADLMTYLNQTLKIRINTIGIGGQMAQFLTKAAKNNDGQYKQVD